MNSGGTIVGGVNLIFGTGNGRGYLSNKGGDQF